MPGEDGEDQEDGDPMEGGAPMIDSRTRVWNPGDEQGPPTEEERARFGIPAPLPPDQMARLAAKRVSDEADAPRPDPRIAVLAALVAKFPEFQADWPEKVQERWFAGFERIMDAGLK